MGRHPKFKSAAQTFLLDLRNSRKLSLVDKCCLLSEETNVPRSVVVSMRSLREAIVDRVGYAAPCRSGRSCRPSARCLAH